MKLRTRHTHDIRLLDENGGTPVLDGGHVNSPRWTGKRVEPGSCNGGGRRVPAVVVGRNDLEVCRVGLSFEVGAVPHRTRWDRVVADYSVAVLPRQIDGVVQVVIEQERGIELPGIGDVAATGGEYEGETDQFEAHTVSEVKSYTDNDTASVSARQRNDGWVS